MTDIVLYAVSIITPDGKFQAVASPDIPGAVLALGSMEEAKGALKRAAQTIANEIMETLGKDTLEVEWGLEDEWVKFEDGTMAHIVDLSDVAQKVTKH